MFYDYSTVIIPQLLLGLPSIYYVVAPSLYTVCMIFAEV